ncbi:hypothetical protein VC83_06249 [Pseudogymnoascus destructans]|uniref:Uncharacterized protein n=1 Tax=Pseudogymnoascus destructans TaxID=655981 RepID=A0A177AC53_9PEZI|nr:uncharacterized protein VC83_06249 [Pseudogymnoascus destructans]OAF58763.1 hypothetical protein VC83_06249 [Pseudogymnoascus destructans]
MANSIGELSIDGHDILETLDAELDNQLLRTMNEARMSVDSVLDQMNSDVKPSVEEPVPNSMACGNSDGVDAAYFAAANTIAADTATANGSTNFRKKEIPQTPVGPPVGPPVVEFGKPWKPTTNGRVSIIRTEKSQEGIPQTEAGKPKQYTPLEKAEGSFTP